MSQLLRQTARYLQFGILFLTCGQLAVVCYSVCCILRPHRPKMCYTITRSAMLSVAQCMQGLCATSNLTNWRGVASTIPPAGPMKETSAMEPGPDPCE